MEFIEFTKYIKIPVTVLHVISVVIGMGSALVSDLLFSFFSKDKHLDKKELSILSVLSKVVFYALIVISISGILIFFSNIDKYIHSTKFLSKMSIMFILLVNGYVLNHYVWPHLLNKNFFTLKREIHIRRLSFVCGAISVISWLSVCALGVIDSLSFSYGFIMSIYFFAIFFGVIVSLVIEKRELN